MTRRSSTNDGPWVLALGHAEANAEERAAVREALRSVPAARRAVVIHTCRRVEVIGFGTPPTPDDVALVGGVPAARRAAAFVGRAAVVRVLRIAAGLESAVVGEDQVLAQVRAVLVSADDAAPDDLDPPLRRLLETAIGVGRRARSGRPLVERSLADRGLGWLSTQLGGLPGKRLVVAGAGPIGQAAAKAADALGAQVRIASGDRGRAARSVAATGATAWSLGAVVAQLDRSDGLIVALAGAWPGLAAATDPLPAIVDLSAPRAVPSVIIERLGGRFADLDSLAAPGAMRDDDTAAVKAYVARAASLVDEATDAYLAWLFGRAAIGTLVVLRSRVEARRASEVDRLFRRQPTLDGRERGLIEQLSQRLVASVLHEPTRRLREDVDGQATDAARVLFSLELER